MGAIPAAVFLIALLFIPESPRWLLMVKREDKARKLLGKVNDEETTLQEVAAIKRSFADEN